MALEASNLSAAVLRPCRASGSTVEMIRSLATRLAIRNTPSSPSSRSCRTTHANNAPPSQPPQAARGRPTPPAARGRPWRARPRAPPSLSVLVIADRLARPPVVIITAQQPPQFAIKRAVTDRQRPADRRTHQRDRVHRRDRVIRRRAVQQPPTADQPSPLRRIQRDLEDPIGPLRSRQPRPHIDQHRVHEPGVVELQPAPRRTSTARQTGTARLPPGQSTPPAAAHHHHRQDPRPAPTARHRRTSPRTSHPETTRGTQEGEALVAQRSEKMRWSVCACIRRAACPDGRWALIRS